MSLLIKALATAEKDKQKASQPEHGEPLTTDTLALAPLELQIEDTSEVVMAPDNGLNENAMQFTLSTEGAQPIANEPSLAEEAGLINTAAPKASIAPTANVIPPASATPAASVAAKSSAAATKASASKQKDKVATSGGVATATVASQQLQANQAKENNQRAAAGAFVANQAGRTQSSSIGLILIGVAGALLILLGLYGYQYFQELMKDEVVVVTPAAPPPPSPSATVVNEQVVDGNVAPDGVVPNVASEASALNATNSAGETNAIDARGATTESAMSASAVDVTASAIKPQLNALTERIKSEKQSAGKTSDNQVFNKEPIAEAALLPAQPSATVRVQSVATSNSAREHRTATQSEPLKLVSKTLVPGVDPTLQAAYEAFNRGDDGLAQQRYRQVLQKDVRSIDALLGMAAIAQRQGRVMDSIGWYRKIIEIEPRNSIAQSAIADLEAATDVVGAESRIKSLLVRQPEAATLHAALGNLYAEQNQWSAAQASYFNASQYAPTSADYAFNLAVSLEHLGKSELALAQYQRALNLLNASGAISPDRAQLEARIQALK